jgi:hypothetical protein
MYNTIYWMVINFIFRLLVSVVVFSYLKLIHFESLPILVILLLVFDELDCYLSPITVDCRSFSYQKNDKLIDLIVYCVFIIIFSNLFDETTKKILWAFILWRLIGVIIFYETDNVRYLKIFADFINSTIIAYVIYQSFGLSRNTYYLLIILGVIIKIIYEIIHHSKQYH